MLRQIGDRVREWQLGSDARAGRRVRDEVRRIQWDFARRNARVLATGAAVAGLATAAAAWLAPNDFLSGCAVGAGTVFTIGGLAVTVMMLTGSASLAMGAEGEVWTSSQLRPLRKLGWKLLDHVYYRYGDVDHVLVGPAGVVVVESKWSAEPWRVDIPNARLSEALQQVQRNSRDLRLAVPDLRHRPGAVRSVLFLWGGTRYGGERPTRPVRIGDVEVVVGTAAAKAWRDEVGASTAVFEASEVDAIWARLRAQAVSTDRREADGPRPPAVARLYWTAVASLLAALAGVLAVSYTVTGTGAIWAGYLTAGAAILTGAVAHRNSLLRYPALGWLTGVVVITIALITDELMS